MKSTTHYHLLFVAAAVDTIPIDAFCPSNSITRNVLAPFTPRVRIRHERGVDLLPNLNNKNTRYSTSLFDQFKLRMPWDPPDPPVQQRKTRVKKEEARSAEAANVPRPRAPRRKSLNYDLYSADDGKVEQHVRSAKVTSKEEAANHSGRHLAKLGVLIIDHGSKKQSSNDALHSIADRYESMLLQRLEDASSKASEASIAVKAAHMEIATPNIESVLRSLISEGCTKVICIPYFLSRGRHITIDVPNLIEDAKDILEEEGLLDGVELVMSKHLGSNVNAMLDVVDDLVKSVLHDESFSWITSGAGGGIMNSSEQSIKGRDLEAEVRKYSNRATLLENMLEKKVQQLKTMTNRVTILEDVLNKKLEENDMLRKRRRTSINDTGKQSNKETDASVMANLTSTIDSLKSEKVKLLNQVDALEAEKIQVEKEFSTIKTELMGKISGLKDEIKVQNETITALQNNLTEAQKSSELTAENLQNETITMQQKTISDLQSQLKELLDAYNELEQVQNETEVALANHKDELKDAGHERDRLIKFERSKSNEYQLRLKDSQKLLEEEKVKYQTLLEESRNEYEASLAQTQANATEWKVKYDELAAEQNNQNDSNAKSEKEWSKLQKELSEALTASANAKSTIQELEKQLQQREDDAESTTKLNKELEQQQQLQEYLKGQIQTYYETIQDQSSELTSYKTQIEEMKKSHSDSMLIATNSVEASQRRETDLLNNVEELESELNEIQKEKDDMGNELKSLRMQLEAVDKGAINLDQTKGDVENQNIKLVMDIEKLRSELDIVSKEKDQILHDKEKLERVIVDQVLGGDHHPKDDVCSGKPKQSKLRYLLRPWTLLRKH